MKSPVGLNLMLIWGSIFILFRHIHLFIPVIPTKNRRLLKKNNNIMKLSEKIKLLRTTENLTQPELASKAGIEQSYLSKLENDKGTPSYEVINKIGQAFDMTGMQLINSLSQSYIDKHLTHIPEVAAEYASVKEKQNKVLKRRFTLASLVVVLGVGLFFMGGQGVVFPESEYIYESPGIIKADETIYQFNMGPVRALNESKEEADMRIKSNRSRLKMVFVTLPDYEGNTFIADVAGGRRVYQLKEQKDLDSMKNDLVSTLGMMLIVAGAFMFAFGFQFKSV